MFRYLLVFLFFLSKISYATEYRVHDQHYIFDHLYNLFKTNNKADDVLLNEILVRKISRYPHFHGSSCNLSESTLEVYDPNKVTTKLHFKVNAESEKNACKYKEDLEVNFQSRYNMVRAGLIIGICSEIFFQELNEESPGVPTSRKHNRALSLIQYSKVCEDYDNCYFTSRNISKSVKLFYPQVGTLKEIFLKSA